MVLFITLIEVIALSLVLYKDVKEKGFVTFIDQGKIMFMLWITAVIFYNLKLSSLYNPGIYINLVAAFIWLVFLIFSRLIYLKEETVHNTIEKFEKETSYERYYIISNIIFVLGVLAFIYNVVRFGLAIRQPNKIDKQTMTGATAYIVYMLVLCAQIKYLLFRRHKNLLDLGILILSFVVLFLTLNRGPITFVFTTIIVYEIFNFIYKKEQMTKKKRKTIYIAGALSLLMFLQLFGFMGNLRVNHVMKNYYGHSINQHYGVSKYMPSGFMWAYIYLTSPLENAAYAITNQKVDYTYFNNLFYPFIKFSSNVINKDESYVAWLQSRKGYNPHLQEKAGLNVMSFITEAFQDLGALGLVVYMLVYAAIILYAIKILEHKSKFSALGKILIYSNILSITLWSVFVNSLKLAVVLLNIFLIIFIENFITDNNINKLKNIKGKIMPWKN